MMMTRGLIQVCRKEKVFHRRRIDLAFRRLENGRDFLI